MQDLIAAGLAALESQYDMRVLYACESGSRAWGFDSPDSDFDVRFLFAYPRANYLQLDEPRDTIEWMEGDLDFAGWDIRKALRLLRRTNPALLEWLASPIVYRTDGVLQPALAALSERYHSAVAIHWHYLKMAKGNFIQYVRNPTVRGENVLTKKYLYVANPLCKLLYYERHQQLPPLQFLQTIAGLTLPPDVRDTLVELVDLKRSGMELGRGPADVRLNRWMEDEMARLHEEVPAPVSYPALTDELNTVLLNTLQ